MEYTAKLFLYGQALANTSLALRLTHIPAGVKEDVFFRAHEGARGVAMRDARHQDRHDGASYRRLDLITVRHNKGMRSLRNYRDARLPAGITRRPPLAAQARGGLPLSRRPLPRPT